MSYTVLAKRNPQNPRVVLVFIEDGIAIFRAPSRNFWHSWRTRLYFRHGQSHKSVTNRDELLLRIRDGSARTNTCTVVTGQCTVIIFRLTFNHYNANNKFIKKHNNINHNHAAIWSWATLVVFIREYIFSFGFAKDLLDSMYRFHDKVYIAAALAGSRTGAYHGA